MRCSVVASPIVELVPSRVDWFVLDVEGAELAVLEHLLRHALSVEKLMQRTAQPGR